MFATKVRRREDYNKEEDSFSLIRLALEAHLEDYKKPMVHYLVTVGFFKLLHELDVYTFDHSYQEDGLVFYVRTRDSRSSVRAYLLNLKKNHMLGGVWKFSLIDGHYVTEIQGSHKGALAYTDRDLSLLAYKHMQMGSRPLRFSRYFLYSCLASLGRQRSYGSISMARMDSKEIRDFHDLILDLDQACKFFSSIDFSSVSSFQELRAYLSPFYKQDLCSNLRGMIFHGAILANCYEKKIPFEAMSPYIQELTKVLMKDFEGRASSDGLTVYKRYGIGGIRFLVMSGYKPLIRQALPFWQTIGNLDDLSLYLMENSFDTTTLIDLSLQAYKKMQEEAKRLLVDSRANREVFNEVFYNKSLVTDGISDMIGLVLLLDLLKSED